MQSKSKHFISQNEGSSMRILRVIHGRDARATSFPEATTAGSFDAHAITGFHFAARF
jgi:hypothetical protein